VRLQRPQPGHHLRGPVAVVVPVFACGRHPSRVPPTSSFCYDSRHPMKFPFRVAVALAALSALGGCSPCRENGSPPAPVYLGLQLPCVEDADPFRIALGDLNGDGHRDIVACGTTLEKGFVRVFLAQPGGDYAPRDFEAPVAPRGIALADLDDDGHL